MNNKKITKRALTSSVIALMLCFAMLLGTTYAWFTDTVKSTGNIVQAGTLDVTLEYKTPTDSVWLDASDVAIFNYDKWEPGYAEVRYVKIANEGTLDLRFVLTIVPNQPMANREIDLSEVIDVYMFDGEVTATRQQLMAATPVGTIKELMNDPDGAAFGALYADPAKGNVSETYTIVLKMQETAGNEYQGINVGGGFSINLLAAQLVSEYDSFGNDYDTNATFGVSGSASLPTSEVSPIGRLEIPVYNSDSTTGASSVKVATLSFPQEAIDDDAEEVTVVVKEKNPLSQSDIGVEVDGEVKTYEITVTGVKDNNTEEIEVWLYVGPNKNVGNTVYHTLSDGTVEEIIGRYESSTGNVRFSTKSFSPFSVIVYDEPVAPSTTDIPKATLTEVDEVKPEYTDWLAPGLNYEGIFRLEAPETLDVFYSFKALDTEEEAVASKYAEWKCDFFVKVSEDLPTESIILGGYYDEIGAVAFTNLVEVEKETWIPLLLLVSNGWTYQDIVCGVGEFICGVKDVDSQYLKNNNVKFSVQLRLINPDFNDAFNLQEDEYIVINEVVYDFAAGESTIVK